MSLVDKNNKILFLRSAIPYENRAKAIEALDNLEHEFGKPAVASYTISENPSKYGMVFVIGNYSGGYEIINDVQSIEELYNTIGILPEGQTNVVDYVEELNKALSLIVGNDFVPATTHPATQEEVDAALAENPDSTLQVGDEIIDIPEVEDSGLFKKINNGLSGLEAKIQGLGKVFNFKGTVDTIEDLPSSGNSVGDVYNVKTVAKGESSEYVWIEIDGTGKWEELGTDLDLSGYYTKDEVDDIVEGLQDDINDIVDEKLGADSDNFKSGEFVFYKKYNKGLSTEKYTDSNFPSDFNNGTVFYYDKGYANTNSTGRYYYPVISFNLIPEGCSVVVTPGALNEDLETFYGISGEAVGQIVKGKENSFVSGDTTLHEDDTLYWFAEFLEYGDKNEYRAQNQDTVADVKLSNTTNVFSKDFEGNVISLSTVKNTYGPNSSKSSTIKSRLEKVEEALVNGNILDCGVF